MRALKCLIVVASICLATTTSSFAQEYCKLEYWGKAYIINRTFFEYLNRNASNFAQNTAPKWRWYDAQDYNNIYRSVVEYLKKPTNKIYVTEANELRFASNSDFMPGQISEPNRSKKSSARAAWLCNEVLKPALIEFVKHEDTSNQYQK